MTGVATSARAGASARRVAATADALGPDDARS